MINENIPKITREWAIRFLRATNNPNPYGIASQQQYFCIKQMRWISIIAHQRIHRGCDLKREEIEPVRHFLMMYFGIKKGGYKNG